MLLLTAAFALCGCEDEPPRKPVQPKIPEAETARFALQKMIPTARLWSPDAQPVQLASSTTSDSNGHQGKSAFWRAVFASAGRGKSEPFMWSGSSGVDHGVEDIYNPGNRSTQSWDLNFLKIDTDKAFEIAQEHGGKALLEKDQKTPVMYLLDFDSAASQLRWHVIYGGDVNSAKLTVIVDASSGRFIHKE
ncbi:MAG TPA: hypothetical protein VKW06_17270 [Candidatus Angelobacter sp.]|nr:hypothetical protein [Candidatus Angelobacter sp.]